MVPRLDSEHIEVVLQTQNIGRLGCYGDGKVYVVPVTYVYHEGYIYVHTNEGLKVQMLRHNPQFCFEVDTIEDIIRWRSVIARGTFEELQGEARAQALNLLFTSLAPKLPHNARFHGAPSVSDAVARRIRLEAVKGIVFRAFLTEKTGRFETLESWRKGEFGATQIAPDERSSS